MVFPKLKFEVKNQAVWRFSRGFVRNMWVFQTLTLKSKIWQFGDFQMASSEASGFSKIENSKSTIWHFGDFPMASSETCGLPKLKFKVKNHAVWRFFRGFVRNMWFSQT